MEGGRTRTVAKVVCQEEGEVRLRCDAVRSEGCGEVERRKHRRHHDELLNLCYGPYDTMRFRGRLKFQIPVAPLQVRNGSRRGNLTFCAGPPSTYSLSNTGHGSPTGAVASGCFGGYGGCGGAAGRCDAPRRALCMRAASSPIVACGY